MEGMISMYCVSFGLILVGTLLLRRENRMFKDSILTRATVVTYYDYQNRDGPALITMYTMAVEYTLPDGTLIHAREQSGSTTKAFPIGEQISVTYSPEQPEMFIVTGDNSRKNIMVGMIITGVLFALFLIYWGANNSY